jgi:hypothetical protein
MIKVIKNAGAYRISRMGNSIVINFHGRWSQLFTPLSWEYTDPSDITLLESDAIRLIKGRYAELATKQAIEQVQSVPAAALGLN